MTADDTVTAKLAEWAKIPDYLNDGSPDSGAADAIYDLLGFVKEVLAAAGEPNTSPDYRADAYDQGWQEGRDDMAQRIEQAARKWIGGEGRG